MQQMLNLYGSKQNIIKDERIMLVALDIMDSGISIYNYVHPGGFMLTTSTITCVENILKLLGYRIPSVTKENLLWLNGHVGTKRDFRLNSSTITRID